MALLVMSVQNEMGININTGDVKIGSSSFSPSPRVAAIAGLHLDL